MAWISEWQVITLALLFFFVPGLIVLFAGGVRRLNAFAVAPVLSISMAGVFAVIFQFLKLGFNPLTYLVGVLAIAAFVMILRGFVLRAKPSLATSPLALNYMLQSGGSIWVKFTILFGALWAAVLVGRNLIRSIPDPMLISQTFDNVFHLNAVKHIAVTQQGSSLTLGNLTESSQGFYPASMHDFFALVAMATGAAVPVVINVCVLIIAAVVWPLGMMLLVTRVLGAKPIVLVATGVFAAGLSGFPYLLIGFGVLYSLFCAIALLPATFSLCIDVAGLGAESEKNWVSPLFWLVLISPGVALAHPSAFVALMLFCVPLFAARLFREFGRALATSHVLRHRGFRTWLLLTAVYAVFFVGVWLKVRPSLGAAPWVAYESTAQAIGEVIASAPQGAIAAWVVMIFTICGIYRIMRWRRDLWWIFAVYFLAGLLHMFAAGWGANALRTFMVGTWYNDPFRPAAFLPLATIPVAVVGLDAFYSWLRNHLPGLLSKSSLGNRLRWNWKLLCRVGAVAVVLCLLVLTQSGTLSGALGTIKTKFTLDDNSVLLSSNELEVLRAVDKYVPADESIVVNPLTGASLAYAFSDRKVIPPHMFGDKTRDEEFLIDHWKESAYNPGVCPAAKRLKAYWALDFGGKTVISSADRYLGVTDLFSESNDGYKIVFKKGDAALARLTGCGE